MSNKFLFECQGSHVCNSALLITISVRFTYVIQENTFIDWQQFNSQHQLSLDYEKSFDLTDNDAESHQRFKVLPFGSQQDCIE